MALQDERDTMSMFPLQATEIVYIAAAVGTATILAAIVTLVRYRRQAARMRAEMQHMLDVLEQTRKAASNIEDRLPVGRDDETDDEVELPAHSAGRMIEVPAPLAEAFAHDNVVLFVGHSTIVREGAPTRREFLEKVISETKSSITDAYQGSGRTRGSLRAYMRRNGEDAATEILVSEIGAGRFAHFVREAYAAAQPTAALEQLCQQPSITAFVSTGSDDVVAQAAGGIVVTPRATADFEQFVRTPERVVLQLGGQLDNPATLIFAESQLKSAIAEAPDLRALLNTYLSARTVLFVGMTYGEIANLLDAVGIFNTPSNRSYALLEREPDFELTADRALARFNIQPISIGGREDFEQFSQSLINSAARRRVSRGERTVRSEATDAVVVHELRLKNIGPFAEARVRFASDWTVILGNNGVGKSTILRAIALVLAGTDRDSQRYARTLLKRGAKSGSIELVVEAVPRQVTYQVQLSLEGDRVNASGAVSPLQAGALTAFGFPAVRGVSLPLAMEPSTISPETLPRVSDVRPLLEGGVDPRMQDVRAWIRQCGTIKQDTSAPAKERKRAAVMIESFFSIVDAMAPGFDLRFSGVDTTRNEILLRTSDGEIPMDYVSQGMISMMGWLGVLIQRLFDIDPEMMDTVTARAVVLVDEMDGHLHPEWQQNLVPVLRERFPLVQFITTTHSALMVGSLGEHEVVRVVRSGGELDVEHIDKSFKGYRVDQILTDEPFGMASTRAAEWLQLRDEYARLLSMSRRDAEQERRYLELDALIDEIPPPFERRADRIAYENAVKDDSARYPSSDRSDP